MDTTDMTREPTRRATPRLRFPEFDGPWKYKVLAPFLEEYSERVPANTELPIYSSTRTGLRLQKDYYDDREIINEGEYNIVPVGFFVYRHMSDDGVFKFNINNTDGEIAVSKEYPVFKTVDLNSQFLLYKLNYDDDFKRFAIMQKKGGIRTRLYFNTLCSWKTFIPSIAEQQRIADCLASLDDLIAAHSEKLDALKAHKSGLLQQLFPAEDETVPRLRFPEFAEAGEWEEKKLGNIATIRSGTTPLRANVQYYEGGTIPWVKTTDLNNSFIYLTEERITPLAQARINPEGSILVAMYGGFNQIGRTGYLTIPAATNQAISVLNTNQKMVIPLYLLIWLNAKVDRWKNLASSSRKDPNITGTDVANFPIIFPSITEQQRIADFLSSIDEQIFAQSQKLDALKAHKKGLMQRLFPSTNEVQG